MEKKELKFYETPELEVLNMNVEGFFCESSPTDVDGISQEEEDGVL
ncbi:MAG: hypothetical protein IJ635_00735 [Bacteroidaceae bacterium]|nr:hypothetical protein [Bacteroidaceae bacterium]